MLDVSERKRGWRACAITAAFLLATPSHPVSADSAVQVVEPIGRGTITICQGMLFFRSCDEHHHVLLPTLISVGDVVPVEFGSNLKSYRFPVARIAVVGGQCTAYSLEADTIEQDRIVFDCRQRSASP